MGKNGLKLSHIGYWSQQTHFDFWLLKGIIHLVSEPLKWLFGVYGILSRQNKMKKSRIGLLQYPIEREKEA